MSAERGPVRYVLCPGVVTSKRDGQRHHVGARELAFLYGVPRSQCIVYDPAPWWPASFHRMAEERHRGLVMLQPRYDGDYRLPPDPVTASSAPAASPAATSAGSPCAPSTSAARPGGAERA